MMNHDELKTSRQGLPRWLSEWFWVGLKVSDLAGYETVVTI